MFPRWGDQDSSPSHGCSVDALLGPKPSFKGQGNLKTRDREKLGPFSYWGQIRKEQTS